ncbi:hypothetical protein HBI67_152120 [Parastagonospora nodorum]|nr:hypothetical protein HBI72_135140 [Parastagonospora nodorum]KAH6028792.1 hypothetical protein HBI83_036650 [Parastagonospora nodorum]KAH6062015.1 hypothetical protein HBI67_152120 [Parastagonospora nodorum]KAH6072238.1 hypothetical protein HBI66_115050 [Parastagonospora nodorum]
MQSSSRQPRKWTLAEDQKLREEVEAQVVDNGEVKDWCRVAASLPGRTNKDCRKRWHNSVAGGLKKGQWSKSEDELLARAVQEHGQRWTLVANCVESRSADQCAKRWQQSLDPELDHSEWRDEEDRILIEATQQLGRHWKDIQREHFPGRSKNTIKNRYTVLVRRYQNQGIFLPSRGSSPSDSSTPGPLSNYALDDEYSYDASNSYNTLMPPQHHGTSAGSHRSWSSLDSEAAISTWSHPPDYSLPIISPTPNMTGQPLPDYALAPHPHALTHWDWPSNAMHARSPISYNAHPAPQHYDDYALHARSPISYNAHPAPQHYDDYALHPPLAARSNARASYPGVLPNAVPPSNLPRARAWSEQQSYDSLAAATYEDPGLLQQNPLYRF